MEAVFLGTSLVARGYTPMRVYEDTKICTFNLGTPMQSIHSSYYLLKNAMKHQSPKVVILEVSILFQEVKTLSFYRQVMDNLYSTVVGMEMAADYMDIFNAGMAESFFPMTTYHARWKELSEEDFEISGPQIHYAMGYGITNNAIHFDDNMRSVYEKYKSAEENAAEGEFSQISEDVAAYFDKIWNLCRENGAELVLLKMPGYSIRYNNRWTSVESRATAQLAENYGLNFVDLYLSGDFELKTETYDGRHMNIRGAEQFSAFVGNYLAENYPELDRSGDAVYDAELEKYRVVRDVGILQSEIDFEKYLQLLLDNLERWTVAVVGYGDFVSGLQEADFENLFKLGFEKIVDADITDTYAGVIVNGQIAYEELSDMFFKTELSVMEEQIKLQSATTFDNLNGRSSKVTYGYNTFSAEEGLLFVIIDRETGLPIDNKQFATGTADKTGKMGKSLLGAYKTAIGVHD